MRAYTSIEQLVARVRSRDHQLMLAARGHTEPRDDRPDGYPRGGDGTGRASGHGDPTGAAVEQRNLQSDRLSEHANEAISAVFEALRALTAADAAATKALDPPKIAEPEQRPPEAIWCVSCARPFPKELAKEHPARKVGEAIAFEPRTSATKRSRTDLCNWCLDEWEASSEKVLSRSIDIRLVIWRADHPGRYVTTRVRSDVLEPKKHSQVS
jgi:hypothetical protein